MKYVFLIGFVLIGFSCKQPSGVENFSPAQKAFFSSGHIGLNTDVVIIKKDSNIILEKYARGYGPDDKHLSWSMAKTITGILVAQAIDQGYLSINDSVGSIIPEFNGEANVRDFLQMSSGIEFTEVYSGIPVTADVTKMLYLDGPAVGFGNYTISLPLRKQKPGHHFYYSSGDSNVLMEILRRKMPQDLYHDFPWINLFGPLGIEATFEQDAQERFVGSSYIYMKPADYLKIGQLLLDNGVYKTEQIIPLWYMKLMKQVAPGVAIESINPNSKARAYSSQTTTNLPIPGRYPVSEYGKLPKDALILLGHQGQILAVSPKENLTILRLATDKGSSLDKISFFSEVYDYLRNEHNIELEVDGSKKGAPKKSFKKKKPKSTATFKDYLKVPKLITTLAAKEFCSCYFVVGRSKTQCRKDLAITLPVVPLIKVVDEEIKAFMHLASPSIAQYRGEKLGCYLKAN